MECILFIELAVHKEVCALLVKLVSMSFDPAIRWSRLQILIVLVSEGKDRQCGYPVAHFELGMKDNNCNNMY